MTNRAIGDVSIAKKGKLNEDCIRIINEHYLNAIKYSREAHNAIRILVGKAPYRHGIWIGGTTTDINNQQYEPIMYFIPEMKRFIDEELILDVERISKAYSDYFLGKRSW